MAQGQRTPTPFDVGITTPFDVGIPTPFGEEWTRDIIVIRQKNSTLKSTQPMVNLHGKKCVHYPKTVSVTDIKGKEMLRMSYKRLKPTSDRDVPSRVAPGLISEEVAPGLTSDELEALNLQYGPNVVIFTVDYDRRGTPVQCSVQCNIFLWNWDTKVVFTDIDGTITKSNWCRKLRKGVVRCFSDIKENGYEILYLSGRPCFELSSIRELLSTVQDGKRLPCGPVIHASDGYLAAGYRYFFGLHGTHVKLPYLQKVKSLFPDNMQPFSAGFGNTETDWKSYKAVGIGDIKVFHTVKEGGIQVWRNGKREATYHNGYESINFFIPEKFPNLRTQESAATSQEASHNPGDDQHIPSRPRPGNRSRILPI